MDPSSYHLKIIYCGDFGAPVNVLTVHLWARITVVMTHKLSITQEVNARCHM